MAQIVNRMIRAAKLEVPLYEEVEHDTTATGQALAVVAISAAAAGIGNLNGGVMGVIGGILVGIVGWAIWAGLIYVIGTKMFPEPQTQADWGQLLRTLGFASAPGVLRVLTFIPVLGAVLGFVVGVWMLVAMVIATRQALDYQSTWRAVGVCFVGWVIVIVLSVIVNVLFAGANLATGNVS